MILSWILAQVSYRDKQEAPHIPIGSMWAIPDCVHVGWWGDNGVT